MKKVENIAQYEMRLSIFNYIKNEICISYNVMILTCFISHKYKRLSKKYTLLYSQSMYDKIIFKASLLLTKKCFPKANAILEIGHCGFIY